LQSNSFPSVSVLVPTLNSGRTLGRCLSAIRKQEYPPDSIEIVVADAGSWDETAAIAESYGARIVENRLITGEAGKAAAFRASSGELVALIDSDNIVVGRDWLRRMVAPFADPAVAGTEPMYFVAEPSDSVIDRYCAIFGANDPLCLFIGNYDKYSALSGRWTGCDLRITDAGDYITLLLDTDRLPTIGANGTMYRREILERFVGDYLMDIDIPILITKEYADRKFAKVRVGIRHLFCADVGAFVRKQRRRIRDFFAPSERGRADRAYPWRTLMGLGILRFVGSCITIAPLIYQSVVAYARSRDKAAFFHPVACMLTLGVYGSNFLFARGKSLSRGAWKQ
jgi:glycosyltransferase involved in cell wall biosynthesis